VSPDAKPQPAEPTPRARPSARLSRGARSTSGGDSSGNGRPQSLVSQLLELSRHSVIYGIGGLVSRFLAVIMLPLYTSYVSPGDYGRIEILMSAMAVAVVVLRGGASFGFIRFYFDSKEPTYRRRLIRTIFWAQMAYSTLALILCVVFAPQLARLLSVSYRPGAHLQGSGTSLVIATGVLLWANINYAQMTNLFRAEQRSVAFSIATLANIAITVPLTVILVVVYKEGPLGIIVGNLSGTLVLYGVLLAYRREQLGLQLDRKLLHAVNRFGVPLMAAALAMWVTNFGDRLMLSKLLHGSYALAQVGQYSLANKISSAMVLLFTAFQIAWPAFAYSIEDEGAAKRAYSYVLTYLMLVAAWAAVALSLFAPWIVHLLGQKPGYWPAAKAIPALAYSSVFFAGFIVVTIATGRARQTQFNWIAATAAAGLNFGLNLWLIPAYGMLGAAYATLAAYVLLMVVRTWNAQHVYPVPYQWRRVAILLVGAVVLTLVGQLLPRSLPLAFALTLGYPIALALLGFYQPQERARLRRLLPALR
jgi:O-antigen/teichoic acid export membrane protein